MRIRINGEIVDIDQVGQLQPKSKHSIDAITDRIIVRGGVEARLLEAINFAARLGHGKVIVCSLAPDSTSTEWTEQKFSTRYACPDCDIEYSEVQPRTFSFNSPHGACSDCQGLGVITQFDPGLVVPDLQQAIATAVAPWSNLGAATRKKRLAELAPILNHLNWELTKPLDQLDEQQWHRLLRGREKERPGLLVLLEKELATTTDDDRLDELLDFQSSVVCQSCRGCRLAKPAMSVFLADHHIGQIVDLPIGKAIDFFEKAQWSSDERLIAEPVIREIVHRLKFLENVGVGYLTLGRGTNTLSGGEHQRVRLATSIGSGLTNVCYVLDEPSIGLHQRDNDRLIESIRDLQRAGNSVVLVEHDEATIRAADHIIDMGPGAGIHGGQVVAEGPLAQILAAGTLTADYLSGRRSIPTPLERRSPTNRPSISIRGARGRNLKSINVEIPLGLLVCVTGVSGSGKSTLVNQTLAPAILRRLDRVWPTPQPCDSLEGLSTIDKLVLVDQKPIGRSSRGCPATVTGVIDSLRKIFAATKQAKQLGFGSSRFSFNSNSGWCPQCRGHGVKRIEMNFMPDFFVTCEVCDGRRYNLQTLQVKFNGLSIADVLAMPVDQAWDFFEGIETIARPLQSLKDVGLGYLTLGQSTFTLSGGEAQRVKLATELARTGAAGQASGHTLYILDEPTTGLHFEDIRVLLIALNRLVDQGNSMIVIEHNLDVIRSADWIIDLGPEGGDEGGEVIATGTPETVARIQRSFTGQYLAQLL